MPAERTAMRQVREVLRLRTVGVGLNEIARRVGVAPSTVRLTLKRLASAGLSWPLPGEMTDTALETALFAAAGTKQGHRRHAEPDWAQIHRELKRKHVTLTMLWDPRAKPGASLAGSWRSRRGASGRRSASGQLHCPELLGSCPGERPCSYRCKSLHFIRTENSSQPAGRHNPHGGAAHAYRARPDGSVLAGLTALDRYCGTRDDLACRPGSHAAAGPPARRLVVIWAGHRLHDDVFGSGDRLWPPDRNPAQPVV